MADSDEKKTLRILKAENRVKSIEQRKEEARKIIRTLETLKQQVAELAK